MAQMLEHTLYCTLIPGSSPTNAYVHVCKYVDHKGTAAMLAVKGSARFTQGMNLKNPLHTGSEAHKREDPRRHQKSKTEVLEVH